jgi:hypothetical protein
MESIMTFPSDLSPRNLKSSFEAMKCITAAFILLIISTSSASADLISEHVRLMEAAIYANNGTQIKKLLATPYISVNDDLVRLLPPEHVETWLQLAGKYCADNAIKLLIDTGADPNESDTKSSPLIQTYFNHPARFKPGATNNCLWTQDFLADAGADPWKPDRVPFMFMVAVHCVPDPTLYYGMLYKISQGYKEKNVKLRSNRNVGHIFVRFAIYSPSPSCISAVGFIADGGKHKLAEWPKPSPDPVLFDFFQEDDLGMRPIDYTTVTIGPRCNDYPTEPSTVRARRELVQAIQSAFQEAGSPPPRPRPDIVCDRSFIKLE